MSEQYLEVPPEKPDHFLPMPAGLEGYWWETEHVVCVPLVMAREKGHFKAFIESLEAKGKLVFFPSLVNARLEANLKGHGYIDAVVDDEMFGAVEGVAKAFKPQEPTP